MKYLNHHDLNPVNPSTGLPSLMQLETHQEMLMYDSLIACVDREMYL